MNLKFLTAAGLVATAANSLSQPSITIQPTNKVADLGTNVIFSVTATGTAPLAYQWRFHGTDLLNKTNTSLSLVNVQFTNAGPYSVVVSNDGGAITSRVAWLSVLPKNVVNLGDLELRVGVPTNLASLNSARYDTAQSISPDGLTIFLCSDRSGGLGGVDIWMATRATVSSPWGAPVNLGSSVNTAYYDADPNISPDGLTLYFTSDRPGGAGSLPDIWVASRSTPADPFGTPLNLGTPVNSQWEELGPWVSADGLTLLFSALSRPGGIGYTDIWISQRTNATSPWEPPLNLGAPVNTVNFQHYSCLSADGLLLFFGSNHTSVGQHLKIWVSKRATTTSPWGPTVMIGAIADGSLRARPHSLSADGTTLYYSFYGEGGLGDWDLWQISVTRLSQLNALGLNASGEFEFELLGRQGASYDIEVSTDLNAWTLWLSTNTIDGVLLSDPIPASPERRFYRALSH